MRNYKLEKHGIDELYLINIEDLEQKEMEGEIAEYFLKNPERTIYVVGEERLEGIITRGDYLRFCNNEKDNYINTNNYKFTEDQVDEIYKLIENKPKIHSIPIVGMQNQLLYELRKEVVEAESNINSIFGTSGISNIHMLEKYDIDKYNEQTVYLLNNGDFAIVKKIKDKYYKKGLLNFMPKSMMKLLMRFFDENIEAYNNRLTYTLNLLSDCFDNILLVKSDSSVMCDVEKKLRTMDYKVNVMTIEYDDIEMKSDGKYHIDQAMKGSILVLSFQLAVIKNDIYNFEQPVVSCSLNELINIFPFASSYNKIVFSDQDYLYYIIPELKRKNVSTVIIEGDIKYDITKIENTEKKKKSIKKMEELKNGFTQGYANTSDVFSEDFTVINGERKTVGGNISNKKNIYLYGPCIVTGAYVKNTETIESFLQKFINENKYSYNVRNRGGSYAAMNFQTRNTIFNENDMVVLWVHNGNIFKEAGYPVYSVQKAFDSFGEELYDNILDQPLHCNAKVNEKIAEELMNILIKNNLINHENIDSQSKLFMLKKRKRTTYLTDGEERIFRKWVEKYRAEIPGEAKIGCIVMNCNPFTLGHRYLIEYASKRVDYLYVFVVEEDRSIFSFEDRFHLVSEGVGGGANVE